MKDIALELDEHIEYVGHTLGLIVSPAHTFGTDAILLARFAAPRKKDVACDLGTGCGIIPMLWCSEGLCQTIDAVELQEKAYTQLCRTIEANALADKLTAHCRDLKQLDGVLKKGAYDLVTMNPPYKAENTGIPSAQPHAKIARHEIHCTLKDICAAAGALLRYGGRFCICLRPERLGEALCEMSAHKLEPKRLRLVCSKTDAAPWLCLVEGRRGGKPGMKIERNLFVYTKTGELSAEMRALLGSYREGVQ